MNHFFALLTPSSLQGSEDKRASLFKLCFFSTFFWGLLAHGAALAFHILFGRLQQSFRLGNLLMKFLPFGFKLPYFPSTLLPYALSF